MPEQPVLRYLAPQVRKDLRKKMVFVGGARQVGKTTLARSLLRGDRGYLNWDVPEHRERILRNELPNARMWVFDEIHKYRRWRTFLKGLYDRPGLDKKILVTGSARLDFYRHGGDSLQGRYHYLRLHPFTMAELELGTHKELSRMLDLGGFPEPYLTGSSTEARRWSREYRSRLLQEDVASLERVHDVGRLELLMLRLPELVGSPLSVNALRGDLEVSHKTVSAWLNIFERLYAIFRLSPFGAPRLRAVKKEQKHYHIDWTLIRDRSLRFENLVAVHLLKWVHFEQDSKGRDLELRYFRDVDGREVDFVITERGAPVLFLECKWADTDVTRGLNYLKARFPDCEARQIHATGKKNYVTSRGVLVSPAVEFLPMLV
jgi:predicted AAA+ superfamily ATPase